MASLRVITPGLLTTIQDHGRWGWQGRGVPVAGPMDPRSHRLANTLVGNGTDAAAIEVTIIGPEVEFDDERIAAVSGADFEITVDGGAMPVNAPFAVSVGSVLRFGSHRRGARAYLAVAGGIDVSPVLNSRSTHLPSAMGGLDGRPLRAGDRLPLGKRGRESFSGVLTARKRPESGLFSSEKMTPVPFFLPDGRATVRILPGPQLDRFAPEALDVLQSAPFVVDAASNRMGFRLRGPILRHVRHGEMLSDATTLGALQVPAAGQPILLMADRQTTGGYPSLATVITADIGLAGQLAPGDSISFVVATVREAMAALIAQEQALMAFESGPG
jgi:antagonist of KipI